MDQEFPAALDDLISAYKERGCDIAEMAADLRGAADGLDAEAED